MTIEKKIRDLKKQIKYEEEKLKCCANGKKDLFYLLALEQELEDLEDLEEKAAS